MPLPKPQTNWLARIVVLLITAVTIGLVFPLAWLLHLSHTADFVVRLVIAIWLVLVLLSALWTITVWAPAFAKKLANLTGPK